MYLEKRNRPIAYATDPIASAIRGKKTSVLSARPFDITVDYRQKT